MSRAADDWEDYRSYHPLIATWLDFKATTKLVDDFLPRLRAGALLRPYYNVLVRTGRTSASSPNIQNLPRGEDGVRGCVVPRAGKVFLIADYTFIELNTLAQTQLTRYGSSALADTINAGIDPHRRTGAQFTGKKIEEVTKDERQQAKAVNFGLPGGMGDATVVNLAKTTYRTHMSLEQAAQFRHAWVTAYPEMTRWLSTNAVQILADNLELRVEEVLDTLEAERAQACSLALAVVKIAAGRKKRSGEPYHESMVRRAWALLRRGRLPSHLAWRASREAPDAALGDYLRQVKATTLTGRVRAGCSYCAARNTPFQGLAADGAKLAIFDLVRAGYDVVAFVHDEVVVEIDCRSDDNYARDGTGVAQIMLDAMRKVCPDVSVGVELVVSERWSKSDDHALWRLAPSSPAGVPPARTVP